MTTKSPYSLAGGNVAITATTEGQLKPPSQLGQGGFDQAVVANNSPWIATFISASGMTSVQPFSVAIVLVDLSQVLTYQMSLPAGGSSAAPAFSYLQVDWYAAGNPAPIGSYPYSLPIPTININTIVNPPPPPVTELLLTTVPTGTSTVTVTLPNTIETLVLLTPHSPNATVVIQGTTTGYDYPVIQVEGAYLWWADVSSVADPQVTITFTGLAAGTWYVLADIAPRLTGTQDFADGTVGLAAPGMAVQLGARDAALDLQALKVNAAGELEVTGGSAAPVLVGVNQVTVGATPTLIAAANPTRTGLTIYNPSSTVNAIPGIVWLGGAAVTTADGDILEPTESVTYGEPGAWYGITSGGSLIVSYEDE
jgi:hypothetical protein